MQIGFIHFAFFHYRKFKQARENKSEIIISFLYFSRFVFILDASLWHVFHQAYDQVAVVLTSFP